MELHDRLSWKVCGVAQASSRYSVWPDGRHGDAARVTRRKPPRSPARHRHRRTLVANVGVVVVDVVREVRLVSPRLRTPAETQSRSAVSARGVAATCLMSVRDHNDSGLYTCPWCADAWLTRLSLIRSERGGHPLGHGASRSLGETDADTAPMAGAGHCVDAGHHRIWFVLRWWWPEEMLLTALCTPAPDGFGDSLPGSGSGSGKSAQTGGNSGAETVAACT